MYVTLRPLRACFCICNLAHAGTHTQARTRTHRFVFLLRDCDLNGRKRVQIRGDDKRVYKAQKKLSGKDGFSAPWKFFTHLQIQISQNTAQHAEEMEKRKLNRKKGKGDAE